MCMSKKKTIFSLLSLFLSPITLIGDHSVSLFTVSVTNTPYWIPVRLFFHVCGHQYTLLATAPSLFSCLRSPIHLIGYRSVSFFMFAVANTPYWLPFRLFFHGCGHQYTLLATVPSLFSRLRSPIHLIGYHPFSFFHGCGSQYTLLATTLSLFSCLRSPIHLIGYHPFSFFHGCGRQ